MNSGEFLSTFGPEYSIEQPEKLLDILTGF